MAAITPYANAYIRRNDPLQICLDEPGVGDDVRFWAEESNPSPGYLPFTVRLEKGEKLFWLYKRDLISYFSDEKEIEKASQENDLNRLVQKQRYFRPSEEMKAFFSQHFSLEPDGTVDKEKVFERFHVSEAFLKDVLRRNNPLNFRIREQWPLYAEAAKRANEVVHLSAKHFGLNRSIYILDKKVFFGLKDSLIDTGGSSRIKKAIDEQGRIVVRRISPRDLPTAQRTIRYLESLQSIPRVIRLLGSIHYKSLNGQEKLVSFHPLYPTDLFAILPMNSKIPLSKNSQHKIAKQLLETLNALDGSHGDLKPENILVEGDDIVLTDFDTFWKKETLKETYTTSAPWQPPETVKWLNLDVEKLDVWGAGCILYYLFSPLPCRRLPWHLLEAPKTDHIARFSQADANQALAESQLSDPVRNLLRKMIVFDPRQRYTIRQALHHFNEKVSLENSVH
jgi:hypothetical protein